MAQRQYRQNAQTLVQRAQMRLKRMYDNDVVQCVAVCCSVLQCVAVCCNARKCASRECMTMMWYTVLQCVAVCCSVLQRAQVHLTRMYGSDVVH